MGGSYGREWNFTGAGDHGFYGILRDYMGDERLQVFTRYLGNLRETSCIYRIIRKFTGDH